MDSTVSDDYAPFYNYYINWYNYWLYRTDTITDYIEVLYIGPIVFHYKIYHMYLFLNTGLYSNKSFSVQD